MPYDETKVEVQASATIQDDRENERQRIIGLEYNHPPQNGRHMLLLLMHMQAETMLKVKPPTMPFDEWLQEALTMCARMLLDILVERHNAQQKEGS